MIKIVYQDRACEDIICLVDFLMVSDVDAALATLGIIGDGVLVLKNHPEIGRPTENDVLRELFISRGRTGYIALYEFDQLRDIVIVLKVKHQREDALH